MINHYHRNAPLLSLISKKMAHQHQQVEETLTCQGLLVYNLNIYISYCQPEFSALTPCSGHSMALSYCPQQEMQLKGSKEGIMVMYSMSSLALLQSVPPPCEERSAEKCGSSTLPSMLLAPSPSAQLIQVLNWYKVAFAEQRSANKLLLQSGKTGEGRGLQSMRVKIQNSTEARMFYSHSYCSSCCPPIQGEYKGKFGPET